MRTLTCPAKVNLFLAVRSKDSSGYHEIETVLARAPELFDEIEIEAADDFSFHCDSLPGQSNSVVQAVRLLETHTGRTFSYKITLRKNIPPRSGLGGGASDAAAILLYLNEHEKLGLTRDELQIIGAQIGMDVPFFVSGAEVALGTHYGEIITPLHALPFDLKINIELAGHDVSTPEAYARWDAQARTPAPTSKFLLAAIQNGHAEGILAAAHNDFEQITPECGPYTKTRHLCGSGGAVFKFASLPLESD
jgi:4-diphosphocytidyl-2-C-methyl-D-erythritol kinase